MPLSFSCPHPWWENGYVSHCIRDSYFYLFVPIGAAIFSLGYFFLKLCLFLLEQMVLRARRRRRAPAKVQETCSICMANTTRRFETTAIAADIFITIAVVPGPLGYLALAVYLFVLSVARKYSRHHGLVALVGSHLACLYCVQWICILVAYHEYMETLNVNNSFVVIIALLRLGIYTVLVFTQWTTPRHQPLYFEDNDGDASSHMQSPEVTASPFSLLFFAWVDGLVWKAFRTGKLQGADLFPINQDLASENVNANLLRTKTKEEEEESSSQEGQSLLRLFASVVAPDLLRQGTWAAVTGVLVFMPPFLIKLILEYLQDPGDLAASRNVRWYVFGLLASSLAAGIADSHCGCKFDWFQRAKGSSSPWKLGLV